MDLSREIEDGELVELIYQVLEEYAKDIYLPLRMKMEFGRDLFNAFRKLDILQELLEDESITEIMINGLENIFVEKKGEIYQYEKRFVSRKKLEDIAQQIASGCNRTVNEAEPIVDARLPDGSRVNLVLLPVALNGPIITIRKFPKEGITMKHLIAWGSISREAAEFLEMLVKAKYNMFISGGTGSGKTTFLNALSQFIPEDERIITIEDNAELRLQSLPNLVRLEARNANMEGEGRIDIRELIRTALRMRPDRVIVGEVRSAETIDMLQAMNTGHDGSLSTGHGNSPKDMIGRLETMVLMGMEIPIEAVQRQIASGIDIIIHLGRMRDKTRKVLEIIEITGYEKGEIQMNTLYEFQEKGSSYGKVRGSLVKKEELQKKEKLLAAGY
ncbi:MAG: CpaF family protein [Sellimonas intestinalis]|uniref:CpaF family protein n=1 Tax=Sellimonas intestinalis TaxID=1653434 RepID=UPI001FA716B3|nr:CpaF family protein [Sellimonas intestinalis]